MEEDTNLDQSMPSEPMKNSNPARDSRDSRDSTNSNHPDWPTTPFDGIAELRQEIELLKEEIKKRDNKIEQLQDHVLFIETETLKSNKKRRLSNDELENQLSDSKDDKILQLQKEIDKLKEQIEEKNLNKQINTTDLKQDTPIDTGNLMKMIEDKLQNGLQAIQTNVKSIIDERLSTSNTPSQQRSYATAVGTNRTAKVSDLRSIMLANKNEEIEEEKDRQARAKNIIIHGKSEGEDTDDKHFAESLIKELQIGAPKITKMERIGQENGPNLKRPIKIVMNSEEEKEKILNNLRHLKGKELYKGIGITADYTYSERQLINSFREKANIQNDLEDNKNYIWRVRGTPKNGLFLKKFNKVN